MTPTENPVLVLMARAILARSYGPGRVPDLESRDTRAWREALADAQAALSVLPVEKGSDVANREDFSSAPLRASELPAETKQLLVYLKNHHHVTESAIGIALLAFSEGKPAKARAALERAVRMIEEGPQAHPYPADGDNQSPGVAPSAPLSEPIDFPSNSTEEEGL